MPGVLIVCPDAHEGGRLEELFRRAAARCTDEPLECAVCPAPEQSSGWDVCCVDVSGGAHTAETARAANPDAFLILIAPPQLSPMEYLRPSILAAGLLLRPYTDEQAYGLALQALRPSADGQGSFRVETREGAQLVPYRNILYFEAREKKISLVTERGNTGSTTRWTAWKSAFRRSSSAATEDLLSGATGSRGFSSPGACSTSTTANRSRSHAHTELL